MQDDIVSKQALKLMHVNVVLIFFSRSSYKTGINFFHLDTSTVNFDLIAVFVKVALQIVKRAQHFVSP